MWGQNFYTTMSLINPYRNFFNELYIMKSYPLLQEVMESLGFEISMYREGEFKTTEFYNPDFPVKFHILPKGARPTAYRCILESSMKILFPFNMSQRKRRRKSIYVLDF